MMFRTAVIATLATTVAAKSFTPNKDISMTSKVGQKIMQKARQLEQNQQQQNNEDNTWMVNYKLKYLGCSSLIQVNREAGGEDDPMLYTQNLVKFGLVPEGESCSSAKDGDAQYVVNMMEFVDAYTEMKMEEQERNCEYVRENCYCDNANDDEACENQCYADKGMDYCIEYEGEEEFEIQRYLECAELEGADGNNNNGGNYNYNGGNQNGVDMYRQYYVGPTCADDGKSINMAVFMDAGCSTKASSGVFEAFNYGKSLPYESESIVKASECISCERVDEDQNQNNNNNNNNNNYNRNYELNELCEQSYEQSAKCEADLSVGNYFYADTTGCTYINNILPRLEKATRKISSGGSGSGSGGGAATVFAVMFFLTSCVLGAYSFFLYRKIHRAKVNLSHSEGMAMA